MAYYYAYAYLGGRVTISNKFPSYDEAYREYVQEMHGLVKAGHDLSRMRWRGVWDEVFLLDALANHLEF